jgi:hypothetical protein
MLPPPRQIPLRDERAQRIRDVVVVALHVVAPPSKRAQHVRAVQGGVGFFVVFPVGPPLLVAVLDELSGYEEVGPEFFNGGSH